MLVADRSLFYPASPEDAARITRTGRFPGDSADVELSVSGGGCPGGTAVAVAVAVTVPEAASARSGAVPGRVLVDRAVITAERVGRAFQPWHVDVEPDISQRWRGYQQPVMTLTLRNLVDADNPKDLREREDDFVAWRLVELAQRPVPQSFDLAHLRAIHDRLFQDVYPWAGETRTVDMGRPGSPSFCPWDRVGEEFALVADHVERRGLFVGIDRDEFVERASRVYDAVNRVHAFREGNGRTQREWMGDLARGAGYRLVWDRVQGLKNDQASALARSGDRRELKAMFDAITERATPPGPAEPPPVLVRSPAEVALRGLPPVGVSTTRAVDTSTAGSLVRPAVPYCAGGRSPGR